MPTNPTAPSAVPDFPALSNRVNYNAMAYAWAQHMDLVFPGEMSDLATVTYENAVEVASNTATAVSSAAAALASETAAASYTNVARWVSGANYAVDVVRFSPITNLVYRCIATATGRTVDPSSDTGYWSSALIQTVASGGTGAGTAGQARTNLDVPSRAGAGASGTWSIDINGHAASASYADSSGTAGTAGNVSGIVARANGGTGSNKVPAFSVYRNSAQTLANNTWVKVQFNSELFDTDGYFDATTNFRFQPAVAGYYQISLEAACTYGSGDIGFFRAALYLNNSSFCVAQNGTTSMSVIVCVHISRLIYFNGSTDYLEAYVNQSVTPDPINEQLVVGSGGTFLTGHFVRGA